MQDIEEVFFALDKKSKAKEQFYNSIPDALHDLHTSKCKIPNNQPNDAYLRKAAESIKVCISKQLQFGASIEKVNGNQAKTSKDSKKDNLNNYIFNIPRRRLVKPFIRFKRWKLLPFNQRS